MTSLAGEPRPAVLLVEDDHEMHRLLVSVVRGEGADVVSAYAGPDAVAVLTASRGIRSFALVITDVRLPGCSGLEVVAGLRLWDADLPVIVITAFGDATTHGEALRLGARVLDKPFDLDDLRRLVRDAVPRAA